MGASQYKAKQMSAIDPNNSTMGASGTMPKQNPTLGATTRPPNMPKKGANPKSSMFDGPYGGKKPQS